MPTRSCLLICLLAALFALFASGCATTPPAAQEPAPTAQAQPEAKQETRVLSDGVLELTDIGMLPSLISKEQAQGIYEDLLRLKDNTLFLERGFRSDGPYLRWFNGVQRRAYCDACELERADYLKHIVMLGMNYQQNGGQEDMLTRDLRHAIEDRLKTWGKNPQYMERELPEGVNPGVVKQLP